MLLRILVIFVLSFAALGEQRISSTVPSLSETLYELGLDSEVVGVSRFCLFDKKFCSKDKIGTSLDINYEKILKLNTSIVLLSSKASSKQINNLKKLGVETIALAHDRLDDVFHSINFLGKKFSREKRAKELIDNLNKYLTKKSKKKPLKVLFLISSSLRDGEIVKALAAGEETFYSDILDRIGHQNVLSGGSAAYPEIGRERLLSLEYDVIFEIYGAHNKDSMKSHEQAWKKILKESKKTKYIQLYGDYHFIPGPRVWKIAEDIKNSLEVSHVKN
ncbi:putative transport system lipoprotein [Halobacteriovorax marinus SJ]|uniref:Transport system lipoprotein n=1 Tax=Halobacteriovorax marinus (strain ATCC BAA-682 / DSM 15412 / SJ) TaxID=862908 RepID=E1X3C2_HALMS|nr:helical backbone metal receptor [Halobacteriovorax marinus]CBW25217.1 putative transport system lipoprotein [Halobacteriovorax marinus SJ]